MVEKALLKEKEGSFSFLELPPFLPENSKNLKIDVAIAWQMIVHMDELESNEEYWRKILDSEKTGKSYDVVITHIERMSESIIYSELSIATFKMASWS